MVTEKKTKTKKTKQKKTQQPKTPTFFFPFVLFCWLVCSMQCEMCYFFSLLGTGSYFLCLLQMFRKLIPRLAPVWHWPRSTLPHPAFILLHRSICSLFLIPLPFVHKTIRQPPPPSPHLLGRRGERTDCLLLVSQGCSGRGMEAKFLSGQGAIY